MPFRPGDQTESFEVRILKKTLKSYLVEVAEGVSDEAGKKYFVPLSQIATDPIEPDDEGRVVLEVSDWWWKKRSEFEAD